MERHLEFGIRIPIRRQFSREVAEFKVTTVLKSVLWGTMEKRLHSRRGIKRTDQRSSRRMGVSSQRVRFGTPE